MVDELSDIREMKNDKRHFYIKTLAISKITFLKKDILLLLDPYLNYTCFLLE